MKVQELYSAVAGITGDNALESAKWFYQALNRSLKQLNRIKPYEKHISLLFNPPIILCDDELRLEKTDVKEYEIKDAAAISCGVCGNVSLKFTVGVEQVTKTINSAGLMKYEAYDILSLFSLDTAPELVTVEITALAESHCKLKALDTTIGLSAYYNGEYLVYDMSALVNDFVSFTDMPMESLHAEECGYRFTESTVLIPVDSIADEIEIYYRAKPVTVEYDASPSSDTTVIGIRSDLEDLLELLVAYYVNQYSDPDVAQTIFADYQRELSIYLSKVNVANEEELVDRSGWLK